MRKSRSIFCFALRILFISVKVIRSFLCNTFLSTLTQPITSPLQGPAPAQYRSTIFQSLPPHNSTRPIATILIQNMRTYSVLPNTPRVLRECSESTPEYSGVLWEYSGVLLEYSGVLRTTQILRLFDSFQYCGGGGVSPNFLYYPVKTRR